MTSMVSRDDVETELYKIAGPHRAAQLPRLMKVIDNYAITVSRKMGGLSVDWAPDQYRYLKPGDTDEETGKRRCAGCGKVKTLKEYAPDRRYPNGRRRRCLECSPNNNLVREYHCPGCKERLPLSKFGAKKKKHPSRVFKCLACEGKLGVFMGAAGLYAPAWLKDAACAGMDADVFFAERGKFSGEKAQEAIRVCDGCACVRKCLSWALETGDEYAVLGGMTPAQRLKYKRELESTRVARKLNR